MGLAVFQLNLFTKTSGRLDLVSGIVYQNVLYWGEETFCKELGSKYFKLCGPHKVCVACSLFFVYNPLKM